MQKLSCPEQGNDGGLERLGLYYHQWSGVISRRQKLLRAENGQGLHQTCEFPNVQAFRLSRVVFCQKDLQAKFSRLPQLRPRLRVKASEAQTYQGGQRSSGSNIFSTGNPMDLHPASALHIIMRIPAINSFTNRLHPAYRKRFIMILTSNSSN